MQQENVPTYSEGKIMKKNTYHCNHDVQSLSLYIKSIADNINNLSDQFKKRSDKSLARSQEIIREDSIWKESENGEYKSFPQSAYSTITNPYARQNTKTRQKITNLLLTGSTNISDQLMNQSISFNRSFISDDPKNQLSTIKNTINQNSHNTNTVQKDVKNKLGNKNMKIIKHNEVNSHKTLQQLKTIKPQGTVGLSTLIRSKKSLKSNGKTDVISKTNKSKVDLMKSHISDKLNSSRDYRIEKSNDKSIQERAIKKEFKPYRNQSQDYEHIKVERMPGSSYKIDYTKKKTQIRLSSSVDKTKLKINHHPITKDKALTEIFLLYLEMSKLNQSHTNNKTNQSYAFYNEMKSSYMIRNCDSAKETSFNEVYTKNRETQAVIFIQKHWRKWKINRLLSSANNNLSMKMTHEQRLHNIKELLFKKMTNSNSNFSKMISMINKVNEYYTRCSKDKNFILLRDMMLSDFQKENSKGIINPYSNIINLIIQMEEDYFKMK